MPCIFCLLLFHINNFFLDEHYVIFIFPGALVSWLCTFVPPLRCFFCRVFPFFSSSYLTFFSLFPSSCFKMEGETGKKYWYNKCHYFLAWKCINEHSYDFFFSKYKGRRYIIVITIPGTLATHFTTLASSVVVATKQDYSPSVLSMFNKMGSRKRGKRKLWLLIFFM